MSLDQLHFEYGGGDNINVESHEIRLLPSFFFCIILCPQSSVVSENTIEFGTISPLHIFSLLLKLSIEFFTWFVLFSNEF